MAEGRTTQEFWCGPLALLGTATVLITSPPLGALFVRNAGGYRPASGVNGRSENEEDRQASGRGFRCRLTGQGAATP